MSLTATLLGSGSGRLSSASYQHSLEAFCLYRWLNCKSFTSIQFVDNLKRPVTPHLLLPSAKYNPTHFTTLFFFPHFYYHFSLRWYFKGICPLVLTLTFITTGFSFSVCDTVLSLFHCQNCNTGSWNVQIAWARHVNLPDRNAFHAAFWVKHAKWLEMRVTSFIFFHTLQTLNIFWTLFFLSAKKQLLWKHLLPMDHNLSLS